jgi:uncharacterized tellurite resistance protein B-like protein
MAVVSNRYNLEERVRESLTGHMKTAGNSSASKGLFAAVLCAEVDQTGHLALCNLNLLATKGGQRDVGDLDTIVSNVSISFTLASYLTL